jgi:hypothetical protein
MEKYTFFLYDWKIYDIETEITSIRIYGLDKDNKNVLVGDFTPFLRRTPVESKIDRRESSRSWK